MSDLNVTVNVDDRRLIASLDKMTDTIREALRPAIEALTSELLTDVQMAEPSRTGRLRSSTRTSMSEGKDYIRGRVRIEGQAKQIYAVAAALEYGSHRSIEVGSYQRRAGMVRAYRRRENIVARRFLRGSAAAIRQRAITEIEAAVATALAKGD